MKYFIVFILTCIICNCYAQRLIPDSTESRLRHLEHNFWAIQENNQQAGMHMAVGTKLLLSGISSAIIGGAMGFASTKIKGQTGTNVMYTGFAFTGAGIVLNITGVGMMLKGHKRLAGHTGTIIYPLN